MLSVQNGHLLLQILESLVNLRRSTSSLYECFNRPSSSASAGRGWRGCAVILLAVLQEQLVHQVPEQRIEGEAHP